MTAGEFRNGVTFEMDGQVQQVIEFQHVKPGKGAAFVRVKMKNVVTGAVTETSFNPTAKFEEAFVERRSRSLRPSRALRATLLLTYSSPLPLRPVLLLRFRSLSSRVSASRSTPVPVSIWAAARPSKNLQPTGMAAAIPDLDI